MVEMPSKKQPSWIETEMNQDWAQAAARPDPVQEQPLQRTWVEIDGKRVALGLPSTLLQGLSHAAVARPASAGAATPTPTPDTPPAGAVLAPMAGSLIAWKVADGQAVQAGAVLAVMESMKMESNITAAQAGVVRLQVPAGATLQAGQTIARID